jgi:D-alanyl-D-alanine carboxypeptidase (penicillin-binding protein 5/6)
MFYLFKNFLQKLNILILIISIALCSVQVYAGDADTGEPKNLYAGYAALVDGENNRLLFGKNADTQVPMASTTKIMTCIIALEYAPLDLSCTTSQYAASMPEVKLFAKKDEVFTLKDLLYSLMLRSHNDSAVIIAENVASYYLAENGIENSYSSKELVKIFANLMNEKASELGCTSTYYITPNGLDDTDEYGTHSTTAYELAVVMSYCIQNEMFLEITGTSEYSFSSDRQSYSVSNANSFLNMYPDIISGKTGFTAKAGYCYVCAYRDEDRILIAVVLACGWPYNKSYRWSDTKKLLDYGRNSFTRYVILNDTEIIDEIKYNYGYETRSLAPYIDITENIGCILKSSDKVNLVYSLQISENDEVSVGDTIGNIDIYINDESYDTVLIKSADNLVKADYRYYLNYCVKLFFCK